MKLNKKYSDTPKTYDNAPKEYKRGTKVDWKLYRENKDAVIPYGKYAGKTLGYIIKWDDNYYNWLHAQSLMGDWGLVEKIPRNDPVQYQDSTEWYITDTGRIWVDIRQVDKPYRPSQWL